METIAEKIKDSIFDVLNNFDDELIELSNEVDSGTISNSEIVERLNEFRKELI